MTNAQTIDPPEAGTEVAILGTVTAVAVFGTPGGVDAILDKIKAQALATDTDISTQAGRQAVASLAYKIARSKTALDAMGKELGEDNYRRWKAITAERARVVEELDALRDQVRKPLTDWENAEKARVAAHEAALDAICEAPGFYEAENAAADYRQRLAYLEAYPPRDWQEFLKRASDALANEIAKTKVALAAAEKREAEAAEAARIAHEKAEQERREREALIAENARREAEAKAKREAEAEARRIAAETSAKERAAAKAAEAERARIERERQEADRRAEEAEAARLAAAAKAQADMERAAAEAEIARKKAAEDAAAAERKRIADAQAKDAAETAAREANRRHRAQIHNEVLADLVIATEISEAAARAVITAIVAGKVRHTKVSY